MEFGYTEQQEKLRQEVSDFFQNELPSDYGEFPVMQDEELEKFYDDFQNKAVKKGYPTAGWPKQYGGLGFTALEQGIVSEEMNHWGVAWPGMMGYALCGPVILSIGNEEQKAKFVPPIARGEVTCFECFTEPNAGSDEANVELRAVPDGDDYILNGQKTFISGNKKPDWLYTLARTADTVPKHRGLSIFMVPGDAPGISYKPLPTMGGTRQNEIFYDNVRVSKNNLIGELNRGFYAAMATLEFERASASLDARRGMRRLVDFCRKEKRNGRPLIKDPEVRKKLAHIAMFQQTLYLNSWYEIWRRTQIEKLGPAKYGLGLFLEKSCRPLIANAMMEIFDMFGQLRADSEYAKYHGSVGRAWEASRAMHGAGTPEILKVVIANRGLGLPRIPRKLNPTINAALSEES